MLIQHISLETLAKRRNLLNAELNGYNSHKILDPAGEFYKAWNYLYDQLCEAQKEDYYISLGVIFEFEVTNKELMIYTMHGPNARLVHAEKFEDAGIIQIHDFLKTFAMQYGLKFNIPKRVKTSPRVKITSFECNISFPD